MNNIYSDGLSSGKALELEWVLSRRTSEQPTISAQISAAHIGGKQIAQRMANKKGEFACAQSQKSISVFIQKKKISRLLKIQVGLGGEGERIPIQIYYGEKS